MESVIRISLGVEEKSNLLRRPLSDGDLLHERGSVKHYNILRLLVGSPVNLRLRKYSVAVGCLRVIDSPRNLLIHIVLLRGTVCI